MAARLNAAALLDGVLRRRQSSADQIAGGVLSDLDPADRARAQSLAQTVLRHLEPLDVLLSQFLTKEPPLAALIVLRIAAAEIVLDAVPAHAAVDAAVNAIRANPRARHLTGMVNAVGRRISETGAEIWPDLEPQHLPDWIAGNLRKTLDEDRITAIEKAHAAGAPLDLTLKDATEAEHRAKALGAEILPTGSLRLHDPGQVSALPGYAEGAWWVQDAAAALPVRLLGDVAGMRVLDLCAAPGGKTMQLAAAGATVTALDISPERSRTIAENLARTGLEADIVTADALNWQPDAEYDAILLDAPCSATGTIRRHPELPFLRDGSELKRLTAIQSDLLDRAAGFLKPGGRMVYCTCSLIDAEGPRQMTRFLERQSGFRQLRPEGLEDFTDENGNLVTLPDHWPDKGGLDGFFAALLENAE